MYKRQPARVGLRSVKRCLYSSGILAVLLALVVQVLPCQGAILTPHPDCNGPCRETDLMCPSLTCKTEWDSCREGTMQIGGAEQVEDKSNCHTTNCTSGGCDAGFKQVDRESCVDFDLKHCHTALCFKETCCRLRTSVQCCTLLPCNVTYEGCQMSRQTYLSDASRSAVESISVSHGDSVLFPFYTEAAVSEAEGGCESVRMWGSCFCNDGRTLPGCEPTNSSTWYLRLDGPDANTTVNATANGTRLDPDLSVTCVVLPTPEAASTAENSTATQGGGSGSGGGGTTVGGGGSGDTQQRSHRIMPRGLLVALVILGSLLLAGCTASVVLWCCGLLPDLHNLRIQNLTSYEPVFTGQSYTPSTGTRRSTPMSSSYEEDIPWTRFCSAVTEISRRLVYGKRYVEESASAAAAAERYRTLNSFGRRRRRCSAGDTEEEVERGWLRGKVAPPHGSQVVLPTYPSSRRGKPPNDDDLGVDEVFTLEDLGSPSNGPAGTVDAWRPTVQQLPVSRPATAASLTPSIRASSGAVATGPPPMGPLRGPSGTSTSVNAATGGGLIGHSPVPESAASAAIIAEQSRPRLNQFVLSPGHEANGGESFYHGVGDGGYDVIRTRPLTLANSGDENEVPPDVDAPLRWLPTPQVTGQ